MPQNAWSDKRERQYEHIKESYEERGRSPGQGRGDRGPDREQGAHARPARPRRSARAARSDRDRLRALERGARPARPRRQRPGRPRRPASRSLSSPTTSTRGSNARRTARSCGACSARSRRRPSTWSSAPGVTCPTHAHPPGDHRPGSGHGRRPDARPLLPGRRDRREPQRAHPRRGLARVGGPRRDAGGGRRGHPRPVDAARTTSHRGALLHASKTPGSTRCRRTLPPIHVAAGGERMAARRRSDRRRLHRDGPRQASCSMPTGRPAATARATARSRCAGRRRNARLARRRSSGGRRQRSTAR